MPDAVVPPTMMTHAGNEIEVAALVAPRPVMRELQHVFKSQNFQLTDEVICMPTCQHSAMDLVNWGDEVAVEKDRLLEVFVAFSKDLCADLTAQGFWADFIDPCSGLPTLSKEGSVYDEVAGMQTLLKYQVTQAGPCKVLMHPRWAAAVYPATAFTNAPADVLTKALAKYQSEEGACCLSSCF